MINKMADEASAILLLICSHEVWVKVTYDWSTALCSYACAYVDPVFTSQSTSTRRTNLSVFLVFMLMLIRPVAGGGAGGARAPPEIFRLELNSATKVEFFY